MKVYHVKAEREGENWTAIVENADGVITWGRGLRHLELSVREAIALADNIDEEGSIPLTWEYCTGIPALDATSHEVRAQREELHLAGDALSTATRDLVKTLRIAGFSMRDTAAIAGISSARVGQLHNHSHRAPRKQTITHA